MGSEMCIRDRSRMHIFESMLWISSQNIYIYIWNRTCNVAFLRVIDDILAQQWHPGELCQQEINDALELIEECMVCLRLAGEEILAELSHYRSATEPTDQTEQTSTEEACSSSDGWPFNAIH